MTMKEQQKIWEREIQTSIAVQFQTVSFAQKKAAYAAISAYLKELTEHATITLLNQIPDQEFIVEVVPDRDAP